MGKLKVGRGPKSFSRMNAERAEKRDANARFRALTQSFGSRDDVRAAMYGARHDTDPYYARRDRSAEAAKLLGEAMINARGREAPGYQEDGSYIDRDGVRHSKAYMDNLQTNKPVLEGKGLKGQRCNRTACQAEGAYWYNHSTRAYYCGTCADIINAANGKDSYVIDLGHPLLTLDPDFADKRDERA